MENGGDLDIVINILLSWLYPCHLYIFAISTENAGYGYRTKVSCMYFVN